MRTTMRAEFDKNHHTTMEGWATCHQKPRRHRWFKCLRGNHSCPPVPVNPNGHSPSNYGRCRRCNALIKWFVLGQHRFGSYDLDVHTSIQRQYGNIL